MVYDEPNMDMIQDALKKAQEIDVDALREYAEQVSKIDKKTSLKTMHNICSIHGQNPDPKLVKHQLPVIQDEFSAIPDPIVTNLLNNPVFESQSPGTETITLNLEDTTNLQTSTFSPDEEIRKRLENLSDKQKELIEKTIKQNGDWSSATDLAIKLMTNSPTGASTIPDFTRKPTGTFLTAAPHKTDKNLNQQTVQPSQYTIIANKIQELIDYMNQQSKTFPDIQYHLEQTMRTAKDQSLDPTSGQPFYWNYIADTVPIGKNAVLVSVNGYGQEALLCYNTRTLFIVDNKLIKLTNPQTYSRTVWRYIHRCIDEHPSFWVYNTNIKPLSNEQRKSHLLAFYQKDMHKNRWK